MKEKQMKRVLVAVVLAAALASPGLGVVSGVAHAATISNVSAPFSGFLPNPCNGETVAYSGSIHTLVLQTVDGSGGLHVDSRLNTQGVSGTGLLTGAKYQANDTLANSFNGTSGGTIDITVPMNFEFIAQGQVPNFYLKTLTHITLNPDGTVTTFVSDFEAHCQ
jgi:hypothetical protein